MSNGMHCNEKDLLAKVALGDEQAFRQVYDHYRKRIYAFSIHLTESAAQADEIVQEVFMKVWMHRAKLPTVQYFSTWLHTIARNCIFDALKRMARESVARKELMAGMLTENNHVEDKLLNKENEKLLREAVARLSGQQQIIYNLSRQHGLRHEEIAARLNISPNTVKVHMVNARKIIREYVRHHSGLEFTVLFLLTL